MLSTSLLIGQGSPIVELNFDNCDNQVIGNFSNPDLQGGFNCDCGVSGSSLFLNSADQSLLFDSVYTSLFNRDFTLSFYFMPDQNSSGIVDILSVSESCTIDSSFTIKYLPEGSLLQIEMARDFELFVLLEAEIDPKKCWQHVVFQRDDKNYYLFLNGEFVDEGFTNGNIVLNPNGILRISDSPCQNFGEVPFNGKLDEFKVYNRVLSASEIQDDYIVFDEILTMDTTIFRGSSIFVNSSETCSDNINWIPITDLSDFTALEPTITPESSIEYGIFFDYGICRAQDSLSITVIDEEVVNCNNLLVPNAFTPNNDGLNDDIGISNSFIIESLTQFEIYDRLGARVFNTLDKNARWDGFFRGKSVNSNVFLYKIAYTCKGEKYAKAGSFTILR